MSLEVFDMKCRICYCANVGISGFSGQTADICTAPIEAYHEQSKGVHADRVACGYRYRCHIDGDIAPLTSGRKEAGFEFGLPFQFKDPADGVDHIRRR